ncbi:hypothetical protein EYR40_006831 [Pleurotus pulmonarius]|nr:hypothetical protein EYR40_006831 [Pleurotus pulmonarius]
MYSSNIVHAARLSTRTARPTVAAVFAKASRSAMTTTPPPSGQAPPHPPPQKKEGGSNGLLLAAAAAAVAGGAYWYFNENPSDAQRLQAKAQKDVAEARQKASELKDAGKARVETTAKQVQNQYDTKKVRIYVVLVWLKIILITRSLLQDAAEQRIDAARASANNAVHDAEARARQAAADARGKVEGSIASARQSTESLYNEAKEKVAADIHRAETKAEEAKAGWFSWLGWGKAKAAEGKKEGAEKVAEGAANVKEKAEKHT